MKIQWDNKQTTIAVYAFLVIVAGSLFIAALFHIHEIAGWLGWVIALLSPFLYGFSFAYLLNPLMKWFEQVPLRFMKRFPKRQKLRRWIAVLLTLLSVLACLTLFLIIVLPELGASLYALLNNLPLYTSTIRRALTDFATGLQIEGLTVETVSAAIDEAFRSIAALFTRSYEWITALLPEVFNVTRQIGTGVTNAIVGVIISIYMLVNKERFIAQLKKVLSAFCKRDNLAHLEHVAHEANRTFSGFISGKILDSLIIGILCFIGMTIFNMSYSVLISVIVGITNVIPYFGPFIGAIPSILLLLINDPWQAFWFAIFILALQQFDGNILGPKILGESTGISAFWVIFAIVVGGGMFGVLGMFVGVPTFAVIYSLLRIFIERRLLDRGLSTQTQDYASENHPLL